MKGALDESSNQFKDWCPQVMERAKQIQENLSPEHPSFIKVMKSYHVSNSFYTCPVQFSQKHLPKAEEIIVFETESGKSYEVKFLVSNCAFSAGWRDFAIAERLLENEVLVFHLIAPCKFKVYIVRAKELAPVSKAPTVAEIDDSATGTEVEKERTCERDKKSAATKKSEVHYMGVRKRSGKYGVRIWSLGHDVWLGTFDTAEEAALAYDAAAREFRGPNANTNFPLHNSTTTTLDSSPPSPEHHLKMKNVYIVRAKELASVSKAPTVAEMNDFATQERVEKERTCERDKKSAENEKSEAHYMGVRKGQSGRYGADIKNLGRTLWLGTFDTAEEAALAYDAAARKFRGAEANTNFPLHNCTTTTVDSSLPSREHHPKMKIVNKVRASGLTDVGKAPNAIEIDDSAAESEDEKNQTCERDTKHPRFVAQKILQGKVTVSDSSSKNSIHPGDSNSSNLEGFQPSNFVSDFQDFKIKVDGTTIQLPQQVRVDYFKLCCGQKSYLHHNLINGIDRDLAASVISETVTISNAIRESKIFTPQNDIAYWNKALDGFEVFGMNIGFIRARLIRLWGLTLDLQRYKEAETERDCVEKKIIELKKRKRILDEEIEDVGKVEARYEEEASCPW